MPTFEISTTTYDEDISVIQVALTKIAAICNFEAGFKIAEPVSRFGWTFLYQDGTAKYATNDGARTDRFFSGNIVVDEILTKKIIK